jgi:hypothetical protein
MRALFRFVRVANDYADADAGRGALARGQRHRFVKRGPLDVRREQHPDLVGRNACKRRLLIDQAFAREIDCDAGRRLGSQFGGSRLKKKDSPALNSELYILHVAARPLEPLRRYEKLRVWFGEFPRKSG